ncbi:MAG: hypothetical protein KIT48_22065 [Pseudolabrys sp.]|nr:hypothetical protein [Pseudolabrys sp.]
MADDKHPSEAIQVALIQAAATAAAGANPKLNEMDGALRIGFEKVVAYYKEHIQKLTS